MRHTVKWSTEPGRHQLQDRDDLINTDYKDAQPALTGCQLKLRREVMGKTYAIAEYGSTNELAVCKTVVHDALSSWSACKRNRTSRAFSNTGFGT